VLLLVMLPYMERCLFHQESSGGWRKDEASPLVEVSASMYFLQCFWRCWLGDRKDSRPIKPVPLIPRGSVPEQVDEESQGHWLIQFHLVNSC